MGEEATPPHCCEDDELECVDLQSALEREGHFQIPGAATEQIPTAAGTNGLILAIEKSVRRITELFLPLTAFPVLC